MKNLIVALFLSIPFLVFAQPKQGAISLGTTVGIASIGGNSSIGLRVGKVTQANNFGPDSETDITDFSFNPRVGYTVVDGFVLGLGLGWGFSKSENAQNGFSNTVNRFSAGPFVNYYFDLQPVTPLLFLSTQFGRSVQEFENFSFADEIKQTSFQILSGLGVAYFPNEHIGLEILVGYDFSEFKPEGDFAQDTQNTAFVFGVGLSVFLGGDKEKE